MSIPRLTIARRNFLVTSAGGAICAMLPVTAALAAGGNFDATQQLHSSGDVRYPKGYVILDQGVKAKHVEVWIVQTNPATGVVTAVQSCKVKKPSDLEGAEADDEVRFTATHDLWRAGTFSAGAATAYGIYDATAGSMYYFSAVVTLA